jgi:hypothetical protein
MPRILSNAMHREINQVESQVPLVWLFVLDIPGAGDPFRLANYPEIIVFHGFLYLPFGVDIDAVEDASSQALIHLRASFENIDQQLQALLETYWAPDNLWQVTIYQVAATFPDEVPLSDGMVYSVGQVSTTWRDAMMELYAEGLSLSSTLPKRRYTALGGFRNIPRRIGF